MKGRFWKKTTAGLLALMLVTGALPANTTVQKLFSGAVLTAHAEEAVASGFCGASTNEGGAESVTWTLDDEGTLTISGTGAMADFECDQWGDTYVPWSAYNGNITKIAIKDGVKSIGANAFLKCSLLKSISIPESVESIGASAFGSFYMTSITIPSGVKSIGDYALNIYSLKRVIVEANTPPVLGTNVFYEDQWNGTRDISIESIYVQSDNVQTYKEAEGWNVYSDQIKDNVEWSFDEATATLTVTGGGKMPDYQDAADVPWNSKLSAIKHVIVKEPITRISKNAFVGCSNLESISVEAHTPPVLANGAFPDSAEICVYDSCRDDYKRADGWTAYADKLDSIIKWNVDGGTMTIRGFGAIEESPYYSNFEEDSRPWRDERENVTKVIIEYGVTEISQSSFRDFTNLTSISIADSVKIIGSTAFKNCSALTSIKMPRWINSFGSAVFENCSSLTSITLPEGLDYTHSSSIVTGCTKLKTIVIPDGTTSLDGGDLGSGLFNLETLVIPKTVTVLSNGFISGCQGITLVVEADEPPSLSNKYVLQNIVGKVLVHPNAVGKYKEAEFWKEYSISENYSYNLTQNGTLTISGIGSMNDFLPTDGAPWKNKANSISKAMIGKGITSIGDYAFNGCHILTSVTIPDTVRRIGDYAFKGCNCLNPIIIPDSVTSIGEYAFSECNSLTSIVIPDSVTSISDNTFNGCMSLNSVTIPNSVTNIGEGAFYGCSSLDSVILQSETPPALGDSAFSNTPDGLIIYVPAEAVDAYKTPWRDCADKIVADPSTVIEYATLTEEECYPVISSGTNKVHVGFKANVPQGAELLDYGLIYYNSGNVIHTEHLTLNNVGTCGIKKAKYWSANITDNDCGVTAVGFITYKNQNGKKYTMYTGELGGSFEEMTNAAKYVTLTKQENKAVVSNGKNKVYVGFNANVPKGYTVEDYGLIYYNSGNVIHTEHLTLNNVGVCGIQKAKYWGANITDNGDGVTAVGFVTIKDGLGNETTLYTEELGGSFAALSAEAEANAANAVTLTRRENKAVVSGGKKKVYVGFDANVPDDYTVEDYGLLYYNSGDVIHTEHLTLENVGVCGIQKAKYWGANITDNGYGVVSVGFVKVKDVNGYVTTLYTEELGDSFTAVSEAAAANAVTLTKQANKAVVSGGKNKVYCGFTANTAAGYTIEDYGLIYYNSGTVIHTEHLTLGNVGVCGIQNAKYWSANITDKGYGVVCVGYVKVKDANGYVTTLYTGELGAKFADLAK